MSQIKTIMHKDDAVISFIMDKRGVAEKIIEIYNKQLLPFYISEKDQDKESEIKLLLQMWLLERTISKTRKDIEPLIAFYGADLFKSNHLVSLNDCYWMMDDTPDKNNEKWEDVNPFKKWDYKEDEYFNLIHSPTNVRELSKESPNLTLSGMNKRFWYRNKDGKLGIITEDSRADMMLYKTAKEISADSVVSVRDYIISKGIIYSFHEVETNENVERIPFNVLYDEVADDNNSKLVNLENCCKKYNIPKWKEFIGNIIKLDEKTGNKERNLCEIGILRDSNTLEIIGFEKI